MRLSPTPTPFANRLGSAAAFALLALTMPSFVQAQNKSAIVPKKYATAGSSRTLVPFSEQPIRYQQLVTGAAIAEQIKNPVRLRGMAFRTKSSAQAGVQIEVQVVIATYKGIVLNGIFDRNLRGGDAKLVVPKTKINLPRSTGGFDLTLPFKSDFTWDGKSDLVFDVRVYSNGNNSRQFFYWWDSIAPDAKAGVTAQYALGANATTSRVTLRNQGLVVRFDYQEGVIIRYGQGCKGQGNFTPKIAALGLPTIPNNGFRINVSDARPSTGAILLWGSSDKKWGAVPLPFDLKNVGIPGCNLLAEPLAIMGAKTTGSSPGSGVGSIPLPIPPSNIFLGYNLYMQWGVIDDTRKAALDLVFSDALRIIIGG